MSVGLVRGLFHRRRIVSEGGAATGGGTRWLYRGPRQLNDLGLDFGDAFGLDRFDLV